MKPKQIVLYLFFNILCLSGFAQYSPGDFNKNEKVRMFFVRHAEKKTDSSADPELSAIGKETAERLSSYLETYRIDAIYSTPFNRTKMTAFPLSQRLGQEVKIYDPRDPQALLEIIRENAGKSIVIVGHSNTVPMMINFLAKEEVLEAIPEDQYGNLYIVEYGKDMFNLTSLMF